MLLLESIHDNLFSSRVPGNTDPHYAITDNGTSQRVPLKPAKE
jgi:hypothetical protein